MGKLRASKAPKSAYSARNAQDVLNGKQIVKELTGTKEDIGSMSIICPKCSANKWKGETSSTCCNDGKVVLERYPDQPHRFEEPLDSKHTRSKIVQR